MLLGIPGAGKTTYMYSLVDKFNPDARNKIDCPSPKGATVSYTKFNDKICAIGAYDRNKKCRSSNHTYHCFETTPAVQFYSALQYSLEQLESMGYEYVILDGHKPVIEYKRLKYDFVLVEFPIDEALARQRYENRCGKDYDAMGTKYQEKIKEVLSLDKERWTKEELEQYIEQTGYIKAKTLDI
ncbi:hypothetical protein OPFAMLBM_00028 [Aeromonas phage avDM12-TAAL]|nr:hypothetical protein OPFAMLBM_00028 [Aeromonas phage avDM12-TAAL]